MADGQKTLRDELLKKYQGLAKQQRDGSVVAAVRLHCIECMGGIAFDARGCEAVDCFLWPCSHRAGAWKRSADGCQAHDPEPNSQDSPTPAV